MSGVSVPLLGLIDTSIVGRLSTPTALGSVALGSWLFDLLYWSFGFLRMGTTGLVAQSRGRGDTGELRLLLARPLLLGLVCGILVYFFGTFYGDLALEHMAGESSYETRTLAATYFGARIWGGPAVLMNYACLGWLLGMGRARLALMSQLALNTLNALLSIAWGNEWGVGGVGAASAMAQWSLCIVNITYLWRSLCPPLERDVLWHGLKTNSAWRNLAVLNVNLWARTCLLLGSFGLINAVSARLGALTLSVNALLLHLQSLQSFILDGFAHGAEIMIGEKLGQRDEKGYRNALRAGIEWTMGAALLIALIYAMGAGSILRLMTHHLEVLEAVDELLIWATLSPIISAPCFFLDGVMIGATRSAVMRRGMLISATCLMIALLTLVPHWGNHGVWAALMLFMHVRMWTLIPHAGFRHENAQNSSLPSHTENRSE